MEGSPPLSPNIGQGTGVLTPDPPELQVEYWAPGGTDAAKSSLKAAFRCLCIYRSLPPTAEAPSLSLSFVRERRKERMLQKLGMGMGKRRSGKNETAVAEASEEGTAELSRLICSAKARPLRLLLDGVEWPGVQWFQTAPAWQTHVKLFPLLAGPSE